MNAVPVAIRKSNLDWLKHQSDDEKRAPQVKL